MTKGNHLGDAYVITLARPKALKAGRYRLRVGALVEYWTRSGYYTSAGCSGLHTRDGISSFKP